MNAVRDALTAGGFSDTNVDLFMAACDRTDHAAPEQGDDLTRQGFFHGRIFLGVDQAMAEGNAHGHPDNTVVVHFQTATPEVVEIIPLSPA